MTDQPTAGRFDGRTHILPVRIYYEDTDFTGLVYHGNYVRFFERGRSDFLRAAGIGHADLLDGDRPLAFVVSKMALEFLRPARIDDALQVLTTYETMKGPRMQIDQRIVRDGELLCRASVEAVCIRPDGRPARPTPRLIEAVRPWLAPAEGI
ncbi:YbgC/FadM family acyl-CoA thioesterase [Brevundimonas poindexterae]|uniref:YbgC/FadM family acyl-CoA thioesterase n=1 Tax=Brevundimonas poindexterae TaxID=74325 RepID=UPI001CFE2582|nr:YbgC/FadM family acyl-CoA thioesterase [Brevundimonas poindexterae]